MQGAALIMTTLDSGRGHLLPNPNRVHSSVQRLMIKTTQNSDLP